MAIEKMNEISDFDEDIKAREALIREAEELDRSQSWNEAAPVILDLRKRWRRIRYWDSAYEDELAEKFDALIDEFYAKRKEEFQSIRKVKEELIERARTLSGSQNWKQTTDEMNELMKQWKAAGSAGKEIDDQLWEQFNQARQTFFDRKHEDWQQRQEKAGNARQLKEELIRQAAQLADSDHWQKTGEQFRKLMDQWKASGYAGREVDDQLWEQFNGYRQQFFDRRNEAYQQIHAEHQQKAQQKRELIQQAQQIAAKKEYNRANTDTMKQLNVDWKAIGNCGRELDDELWKEFRAAADDYFDGLKQANEQKHAQWLQRMQEARNRKQELIQSQQKQLRWMKNEMASLLSQTAVDEMAEDIADKEAFIQELEKEIAEINEKIGQ